MQLKNWTIKTAQKGESNIFYLKGNVYGHTKPTCPDGTYIHTSSIISAEDEGETLAIKTEHSLYTVRRDEMDNIISAELVRDFCMEFLGGNSGLMESAKAANKEFMKNRRLLGSGMLYLQLAAGRDNCFAGAIYRDIDGTLKEDHAVVHAGSFEDSVIMMNTKVSWFVKQDGVEIYKTFHLAEVLKKPVPGFIRNVGVTPLSVAFSFGGTAAIMPGELYEVKAPKQNKKADDRADSKP